MSMHYGIWTEAWETCCRKHKIDLTNRERERCQEASRESFYAREAPPNAARDKDIVLMRLLDKRSYLDIGKRFGLSGNRIRQIVYKHAREVRKASRQHRD